ncbi:MAG: diguanylate cyclase [Actinomycetota bacterium]
MDRPRDLDVILERLPDPVLVADVDGSILWVNDAAIEFSGLDPETDMGLSMFEMLHPDDHATVINGMATIADDAGIGDLIDVRIRDRQDRWRPIEVRGRLLDIDGQPRIVTVMRLTEDRQALELGAGSHERLRAQVHHAHIILASLDEFGEIRSINAEVARTLGLDSAELLGAAFDEILLPEDRPTFRDTLATMGDTAHLEVRAERMDGSTVHLDVQIADLRGDALQQGYTLSATDITDLKNTQRALRHMAEHDALTGLLNRRALLARLDTLVDDGFQHEVVMLFCDLDGFKPINDRLGHAAGDQVLIEVARRLERSIRPVDLVGRLGGDEFVIVLPQSSYEHAREVSSTIRAALIEPIVAADEIVEVDVSIGVAATGDSPTAARLLATADDAMYAVKRSRARH